MPKFNFGSLKDESIKKSEKKTNEIKELTKNKEDLKSNSIKDPKLNSISPKRPKYIPQSEINQQILETLSNISSKLDSLTKKYVNPEINQENSVSDQSTPLEFNKKLDSTILKSNIIDISKNIPPVSKLVEIKTENNRIDWELVINLANDLNWLYNCYTLTRFLDLIDEVLKNNDKPMLDLKNKWSRLMTHEKILNKVGIKWKNYKIKRLGNTQKHLIDTFYSFENQFLTSNEIFKILVDNYPDYYDSDRDKNMDLRRVRNVLSSLSKNRFIEKRTNNISRIVSYRLKKEED